MYRFREQALSVLPGRAYPLGAWVQEGGVRFAIFSRHATRVWLGLFVKAEDPVPAVEIAFDRAHHRTGDIWSVFVTNLGAGTLYAYRIEGPYDPEKGNRYDATRYLLDPYARLVVGDVPSGHGKCAVVNEDEIWLDDHRPHVAMHETVIYETHVRGLTIHPSSCVDCSGSFRGLIGKIPHLKELGVTAVELLPVQEMGEEKMGRCSLVTGEELYNYWGYNTIAFFSPARRYTHSQEEGWQLAEFREMVGALHDAGIEVILDVVFNHTAEGNELGPTLSFRGIDNAIYYLLDGSGGYLNFSGCGNTMNCNHPLVRTFIMDCLRYWVTAMHIDGFRFDLASILGRDRKGRVAENAPLIELIAEDPILRDVKLIAEAWDAGGAYQVGSFGDIRWAEWNGRYRDDVRRFWRGDSQMIGAFATRITGSADLYQSEGRTPLHSINFVTAHDGFTLRDLVSYNHKRNLANGENNRDGCDYDLSWNCGVEGETSDPEINALRLRMQKNFLATLFLSLGVPMILGGDEFGRTQGGNNNAYCQDNEISWYDWTLLEKNQELFRFTRELMRFRRDNPVFQRDTYFNGEPVVQGANPDIVWFDADGCAPDWNSEGGSLACYIDSTVNNGVALYLMFNPLHDAIHFVVPEAAWTIRINTASQAPEDILPMESRGHGRTLRQCRLEARSLMVLSAAKCPRLVRPRAKRAPEAATSTDALDHVE